MMNIFISEELSLGKCLRVQRITDRDICAKEAGIKKGEKQENFAGI